MTTGPQCKTVTEHNMKFVSIENFNRYTNIFKLQQGRGLKSINI